MSSDPPNSLNEVRITGEIGTDSAELDEWADAIVRGCSICYARIASLRALIEAVQRHPKATLGPPRDERGEDWSPARFGDSNALTELIICGGEISEGDCESLDVRVSLICSARFHEVARFSDVTFGGDARFSFTSFSCAAQFQRASFNGTARFGGAHFGGIATFGRVRSGGAAWFGRAHFSSDARFGQAEFDQSASFGRASFLGSAAFADSSFSRGVCFDLTSFENGAWFTHASFQEEAKFGGARFDKEASFGDADFGVTATFHSAHFAGSLQGSFQLCSLRTATFAERAQSDDQQVDQLEPLDKPIARTTNRWRQLAKLRREFGRTSRLWTGREFGWKKIRALGQIQILSRVSFIALIAIPSIAALTTALQMQFPGWPKLGWTLVFAFFAAAFITLGQLIYQVWSAEDVRKYDEDEFVDRAHKRYPEEATDRNDGLRRAIEHLERIAKNRPDRHKSFIKHHGDTIWIPPRDRIDWFDDLPAKPEPKPSEKTEGLDEESDFAKAISDYQGDKKDSGSTLGIVPGAERRRITIEEGARAEYWLKSREKIGAAWLSGILYLLGIACLLVILTL